MTEKKSGQIGRRKGGEVACLSGVTAVGPAVRQGYKGEKAVGRSEEGEPWKFRKFVCELQSRGSPFAETRKSHGHVLGLDL